MGNQARQSQELELWQVVSSPGNVRGRQAKPRRAETQVRSDMHRRRNASDYNSVGTRNPRPAETRRTGSPRPAGAPGINPNAPGAGGRRAGVHGAAGQGVPRTGAGRARTAGPVYAQPGRQRTSPPRARAKARALKKKRSGFFAFLWILAMSAAVIFMGRNAYQNMQQSQAANVHKPEKSLSEESSVAEEAEYRPKIREDFLTVSEYNRPGTPLASVRNIFVHYTANPGTSAAQNRSYFENLGQTHERAASAHFIIGYEGEIVQCIPLEEEAYAVMERNGDSISIECCYLEKNGSFTQATYDSLVEMLAWLTDQYDLKPQDILRHYDCGGKKCPLYYVEHEDAWQRLLDDVANYTVP